MENHNHYAPTLEFKDIDFCMSKGRLSKKLTEKMLDNKNSRIKELEQKLAKAVEGLKFYGDENNWLSIQVGYGDKVMMHWKDKTDFEEDGKANHCGRTAIEILKELGE